MASGSDTGKAGKGGLLPLLATVAGLTILGGAGGGVVGKLIVAKVRAEIVAAAAPAAATPAPTSAFGDDVILRELKPIVTNLAQPEGTKVRLQASILFDKKDVNSPSLATAEITDDLVAYLKTLTIAQLQGGSGLQSLREDLNERVHVRSDGHVRELIIEALVVQ